MTVSAEGRVENQKLNQMVALLSFGWVFGFQLDSLEKHLITLPVLTFTQRIEILEFKECKIGVIMGRDHSRLNL